MNTCPITFRCCNQQQIIRYSFMVIHSQRNTFQHINLVKKRRGSDFCTPCQIIAGSKLARFLVPLFCLISKREVSGNHMTQTTATRLQTLCGSSSLPVARCQHQKKTLSRLSTPPKLFRRVIRAQTYY